MDGVLRALVHGANLKVAVVVATEVARRARSQHGLAPVSAALLGQGLAAGALLASLQKGSSRLNLQLECDGPLRGLLVDAGAQGDVRGYVKNPDVDLLGEPGPFRWRPALGNSGFLSVLKDLGGGEYYRSSVALSALELSTDLSHYFAASDQVPTAVAVEAARQGDEALGAVAGVLVQALPGGDSGAVAKARAELPLALARALAEGHGGTCAQLLPAVLGAGGAEVLAQGPLEWRCSCSKQRVLETLASLGAPEVRSLLDEQGGAAVTCQFCGTRHEATREELERILEALAPVAKA